MAYTVLARKYRSQTFDDVVGQDAIAQTMKNAIKSGRIAHAYLFSGTRGVGKTTMARIMAKAMNCLKADAPTIEPCCKCESCIAVNLGDDIDVIEIDGASNNSVEEVRRLRENAIYRPARARHKIYIIDEVHMLSTSAFNALLKILEEPPEHVKFIFATTEPNKVLATIQSRCQRFDFSNISPAVIAEQLKKVLKAEKIEFEDDLILTVARMANGSMRDALSLLDRLISTGQQPLKTEFLEQFLGCPDSEKICSLIEKIADKDAADTLNAANELIAGGLAEVQIVDALTEFMRDLMVAKSAGQDSELLLLTKAQRQRVAELSEKFDVAALIYSITALEKIRWSVKNTENPRALLEALLLRFALAEHFLNVEALLSQVASGQSLKKNAPVTNRPSSKPTQAVKPTADPHVTAKPGGKVDLNWQDLLSHVTEELGNGTASLLGSAAPAGFDNDTLSLIFPQSAAMAKQICESNGRLEQIKGCLSAHFGKPVDIKLVIEGEQAIEEKPDENKKMTPSKRREEIMKDPKVRQILTGLGATITNIEEE